jgi:alanyl-tRNA synthetase
VICRQFFPLLKCEHFVFADFDGCTAKVIAIRHQKAFVDQVSTGAECGILLDRTNFYAEAGGQTYDEGFFTKVGDDVILAVDTFQLNGITDFSPMIGNGIYHQECSS